MDYGKSFTYMFEDKDWLMKIIMGGIFTLLSGILIGIPFVLGYALEVIQNIIEGREGELPTWDDLGGKFSSGLMLAIIIIVISIPPALVSCIVNPFASVAASGSDAGQALAGIVGLLVGLFGLVYGILAGIFTPAFILRYAITRDLGQTLNIGAAWDLISANLGSYIIMLIVAYIAQIIASFGTILCLIGVFLTLFWAYLVGAHLLGQYYRTYVAPIPGAPSQPSF